MNATRERKLQFINSFGRYALRDAVAEMVRRKEAPWLTDEQIDDVASKMVEDARITHRMNIRNRRAFDMRRDEQMAVL